MIKQVKLEIIEEDEDGEHFIDLSAPTVEIALEKLGAWERSVERKDLYKGQELEADELVTIEK